MGGQRSVAFVWHLSKHWKPEWGGAFYWIPEPKYMHAEFNSLYLFSVTHEGYHQVTSVSPLSAEKRLAFNGWWTSAWLPESVDDVEAMVAEGKRLEVTEDQLWRMVDLLNRLDSRALNPQISNRIFELAKEYSEGKGGM